MLEIIYIKIAKKKNIIDIPNHRSSHITPTLRGGGVVFVFAILLYGIIYSKTLDVVAFFIPVLLVAIISFLDDIIILSSKTRILIHIGAFTLLFYGLKILHFNTGSSIAILGFTYIFSLGFLNIYNFMDGINGITFLNALITYSSFLYLNDKYIHFTDSNLLIFLIIASIIFGFFNFRKKAICFAGDIGSITIGFSIIYFIIKLFLISKNPLVFGLLFVYLLDGGWTIVQRLINKENIFKPHKNHLYQKYANNKNIPHLKVATYYFLVQLVINTIVIFSLDYNSNKYILIGGMFLLFSIFYLVLRRKIDKTTTIKNIKPQF